LRHADINRHLYEVECRVESPDEDQRLTLPSWIPGSYLLREFARHVVRIRAESNGRELVVEKLDKGTWSCRGAGKELAVTIEVYALDRSVRGAYLDGTRSFFNGTCLFLCPKGLEEEPVELLVEAPDDARCTEWRVATSMRRGDVDSNGFGRYEADGYDELIDHPFEISDHDVIAFEAGGVSHEFIVAGRHEADLERVATDLRLLCETQNRFFGETAPFDSYRFIGLAVGEGYGGLEHRASSSLIFNRNDLPKPKEAGVPSSYQRFLGLCSHEYFHSWNVKRIKPAAFSPYQLERRNLTRLLWVFEGITSYYQDLLVLRSDLIGPQDYLQRLGQILTRVYRAPGRFKQSIAEASFDAWDKLYKPDANLNNVAISYYSKGALVALVLDLTLRRDSDSAVTLDSVMLELWKRFGEVGRGVAEEDFESLVEELSGRDMKDFFDLAVRGTEDLPLTNVLEGFGINLGFRAATGPDDLGGSKRGESDETLLSLGAQYEERSPGVELTQLLDGGPAQAAGLMPGDHLIAINGFKVTSAKLGAQLEHFEEGDEIWVSIFRDDELVERSLILQRAPLTTCFLDLDDAACADAVARRELWLGS
jgi:predicted metalloprotease with PDZ domain